MDVVRKRIMLLLCGVAVLFILGIAGWQLQERHRLRLLYKQETSEIYRIAENLVKLRGEKLSNLASDYSLWDEMASFVKSKDPKWAEINIVPGMNSYGSDAIAIYDPRGIKVYKVESSANQKMLSPDLKPTVIKQLFSNSPKCHFLYIQKVSYLRSVEQRLYLPQI